MFDVRGEVGGSLEVVTSRLCCQRKVDSCSLMDRSPFFFFGYSNFWLPPSLKSREDVTMHFVYRWALVQLVFL